MVASNPHLDPHDEYSAAAVDDARVAQAMQQYLEALEAGRCPSRQEFLAQHPEIAAELAGCLDGLELVTEAAQVLKGVSGPATVPPLAEGKLPLGDFRIIREIGRGGMGIVYEATQLSLGRRVALKVLPLAAALDPKQLQRFKNEAQAAAQLHHTNIVPVYAVGSERGVHYYSMQLIEGYSLADVIQHRRRLLGKSNVSDTRITGTQPTEQLSSVGARAAPPLAASPLPAPASLTSPASLNASLSVSGSEPPPATLANSSTYRTVSERNVSKYYRTMAALIRQAALALEYAHQRGVIHRDIKPANLLLDEQSNLWITDFGLAHVQANVQLTHTGDMLGTLRYMSPEQTSGDRVLLDHRTDVYSLGVTFYELLTVEPLITGADPHAVLRKIVAEEPRSLRAIDKRIPLELETIVLKAIAKSPADRYASAKALANDLERWLDDKPIQARRPTLVEQAARWSRRHWALVTALAGLLSVATLGLLLSTILIAREQANTAAALQREKQQRDMADRQRTSAEENFRQARQAVDTFLELSEEELATKPSLYQTRRRFLAAALAYYDDFLEQRRDDPAVGAELQKSAQWVARIAAELASVDRYASYLLLSADVVQTDLQLSADQKTRLAEVLQPADHRNRPDFPGERPPPPQEFIDLQDNTAVDHIQQLEEQVAAILTAAQLRRLHQIGLQQRGPFAFKNPDVVKSLELTAAQRQKIHAIIEAEAPSRRFPRGLGPPERGPRGGPRDFGPGPPPFDYGSAARAPEGPPPHFDERRGKGQGPARHNNDASDLANRALGRDRSPGGPPPPGGRGFVDPRNGFDKGPPPPPGRQPPSRQPPSRQPPGGRPGDGPPPGQRLGETMRRTVERIVAILSPEQQARWQELVGPPITYELPWRPE